MPLNFRKRGKKSSWRLSVLIASLILSLSFFITLNSCSDSPSTGTEEPEPVEACANLEITETSAKPFSLISVYGLKEEFGDEPIGWLSDPENSKSEAPFFLFPDYEQEVANFVLPNHPVYWMEGGHVDVTIESEDGAVVCSGFELNVAPMDPAPGQLELFIDTYEKGLKQMISHLGYEPDNVVGKSIDEVDVEIAPLVAGLHVLDSPDYENNFRAILRGEAPIMEGEMVPDDVIEVMDAAIGQLNMVEKLDRRFSDLYSSSVPDSSFQKAPARNKRTHPSAVAKNEVEEISPAGLSILMAEQKRFQDKTEGVSGHIRGFGEVALGTTSITLGIAALGSGPGAPAAATGSVVAGKISTLLALENLINDVMATILPQELVQLELTASPINFNEDSEEIGEWNSYMDIKNNEYTITASTIAGFLPTDNITGNQKVVEKIGQVSSKLTELLTQMGIVIWGAHDEVGYSFPEKTWRVNIDTDRDNEKDFFEWELVQIESWDGSPAFELYSNPSEGIKKEMGYKPLIEGISELRIRASAEKFFFPVRPTATQQIEVKPIEIEILDESGSPPEDEFILRLDEEEELKIDLFAEVENADDPSLEWSSENGGFTSHDSEGHHVTYYPPEEEGLYLVVAESIANTGPREDQTPPRTKTARIRVTTDDEEENSELFVTSPGCMTPEDQITFSAFFKDQQIPIENLSWTVDGPGSLSGNGIFTPNGLGSVSIDFSYDDPGSGESHTTQISFAVLESCGELSIESDYFTYTTECVAAQYILTTETNDVLSGIWAGPFGTEFQLTVETDLRDGGEWKRTFTRPAPNEWAIPGFESPDGRQWYHTSSTGTSPGSYALEIQRTELVVGEGEDIIPIFSGSFEVPMEDTDEDSNTTTIFKGEFSGVPYSAPGISMCR